MLDFIDVNTTQKNFPCRSFVMVRPFKVFIAFSPANLKWHCHTMMKIIIWKKFLVTNTRMKRSLQSSCHWVSGCSKTKTIRFLWKVLLYFCDSCDLCCKFKKRTVLKKSQDLLICQSIIGQNCNFTLNIDKLIDCK